MKYEFTGETKITSGITLKRIRSLKAFGDISEGELGGWIEKEDNLSQFDNAWVHDNARAFGNAPMLLKSFGYGARGEISEYGDFDFASFVTADGVRANYKALFEALKDYIEGYYFPHDYLSDLVEIGRGYYSGRVANFREECRNECGRAMHAAWEKGDLDALEAALSILGAATLLTSGSGYSQGDYIEMLHLATSEWVSFIGADEIRDFQKDFETQAKTFTAWAFGDVWCYLIGNGEGDVLASCCGFYGDFVSKESGIFDCMQEDLMPLLAEHEKTAANAYGVSVVSA